MVVPKYPFPVAGGLERQSHELSKALIQRGHAVQALSSKFAAKQNNTEVVDGVRVHRVKWVEFKLARFFVFPFSLARILFKLCKEVDLVHVHNISWFGSFVTLFAQTAGLPVIAKLPSVGDFGVPGMRRGPAGFARVAILKRCDAIIAMTPESMAELAGINYPIDRISKVTNGIASLPLVSKGERSETLKVVFVGRLSAEKGLTDLLHAWAAVTVTVRSPIRLRLIGDGPQADELRRLVRTLGLEESVQFLGHCADVSKHLGEADIFVLPSHAEGNSNAILEAMRAGLPIVATRVGGAEIQVGSDGKPFLAPVNDPSALAARLCKLIGDGTLRLRLGRAMRARVERVFAIEHIAATYEQAYNLILAGRPEEICRINSDLFNGST
jgi:glycosyltransferase involved in cell wall biosynthesis